MFKVIVEWLNGTKKGIVTADSNKADRFEMNQAGHNHGIVVETDHPNGGLSVLNDTNKEIQKQWQKPQYPSE